jgi:hypothetical protein
VFTVQCHVLNMCKLGTWWPSRALAGEVEVEVEKSIIYIYTGWWFQCGFKHFLFSIIYGIILPIDFHIFQDG